MKVRSPVLGLLTSMCSRNRSLNAFWSHTLSSSASTRFHSCSTAPITPGLLPVALQHLQRVCGVYCEHCKGREIRGSACHRLAPASSSA